MPKATRGSTRACVLHDRARIDSRVAAPYGWGPDVIEDDFMAIRTTPLDAAAVQTGPSARQALLESYQRESTTTLKVLRAFPAEQAELRPHPTSNSAQQIAWTFAIENALMEAALR